VKPITGREMCRLLEENGWLLERIKGSHHIYSKPGERKIISIPSTEIKISKPASRIVSRATLALSDR
jgi:predicted RNA binding protein YcfA (HicA-like mRNA interferase family)